MLIYHCFSIVREVKSALYDADERSMHLGKGAEVMLSEVRSSKLWNLQNTWHIMAVILFFWHGCFTFYMFVLANIEKTERSLPDMSDP